MGTASEEVLFRTGLMKASDKFDGKILIVLFCLASPYSMQGVFVS